MKHKHRTNLLVVVLAVTVGVPSLWARPESVINAEMKPIEPMAPETQAYLHSIYLQTWNYLATYVEPLTGIPYDSSARQPVTSISNIGFYLAATAIAFQTGVIDRDEAVNRTGRVVDALNDIEKWRGFPRPWILVRSLKPAYGEEFSYDSHTAVLIGGLVLAKETFQEFSRDINLLLNNMKFEELYDAKTGWLKGGYNVKNNNFAVYQPWGHWYYKYFASPLRLLSFYAIAKKSIPMKHWYSLDREVKEVEGFRFFVTGYEDAGIADHYIAGLFLDERNTIMGDDQRNVARYQMERAKQLKMPAWGLSACEAPGGRYLGPGEMRDEVVAPHASILAAIYFPDRTHENLIKLEELGANPPIQKGEAGAGFGFLDSVNCQTAETSRNFLTANHGMSFLALANLLYDGIVWKTFAKDPFVQKGLTIIDMNHNIPVIDVKLSDPEKI